eukprot:1052647_1
MDGDILNNFSLSYTVSRDDAYAYAYGRNGNGRNGNGRHDAIHDGNESIYESIHDGRNESIYDGGNGRHDESIYDGRHGNESIHGRNGYDEPIYDEYDEPIYDAYDEPIYDEYDEPIYDEYDEPIYDAYDEPIYDEYDESIHGRKEYDEPIYDKIRIIMGIIQEEGRYIAQDGNQSNRRFGYRAAFWVDEVIINLMQIYMNNANQCHFTN